MADEQLSLTWNNHDATYKSMFNTLRQQNILTDVILACDGCQFSAHQLVLVTCSDYFNTILREVPSGGHPIIYLNGVSSKEMSVMLDFMYTGQAHLPRSHVKPLLKTAEALKIKGLGVRHDEDYATPTSNTVSPVLGENKRKSTESAGKPSNKLTPFDNNNEVVEEFSSVKQSSLCNDFKKKCDRPSPNQKYKRTSIQFSTFDEPSLKRRKSIDEGKRISSYQPDPTIFTQTSKESQILVNSLQENKARHLHQNNQDRQTMHVHVKSEPETVQYHKSPHPHPTHPMLHNQHQNRLQETQNGHAMQSLAALLNLENQSNMAQCTMEDGSGSMGDEEASVSPLLEAMEDTSPSLLQQDEDTNETGHSNVAAVGGSSYEEEAQLYLEAFTRSAGLSTTGNLPHTPVQPLTPDQGVPAPELDLLSGPANNVELAAPFIADDFDTENRPYICPICRKRFGKAAILKRHHLAHFRPYNCNVCDRSFTRREVLAEHLQEHNGEDLRLPCPVCTMTIKRKRNLQAHIKVKHPAYYQLKKESKESLF